MFRDPRRSRRRGWLRLGLCLAAALLAAACASAPSATPAPTAPVPLPTATAVRAPEASPPAPSATATRVLTRPELVICLSHEPASLYRYALPEPDGSLSRAHILAALEDGPVDTANSGQRPGLLEKLPTLADGDLRLETVSVRAGERVVDELGRVVPLAAGVTVLGPDGAPLTYAGGELRLPQLTARFTLRPDLRWSDGAPLEAADSVFGFETAASPDAYHPQRDRGERTAVYRALDARTVEWVGLPGHLDRAVADYFWPPLPRHQLGALTPAEIAASEPARTAPLSYGPFVVQEWRAGERLVLARNPEYWRAAEGLPYLERVVYRFVPDGARLAEELASGACDLVPRNAAWEAAPPALPQELARTAAGPVQVALAFGVASAAGPGFFSDRAAREAVAACLDRSALSAGASAPAFYPEVTAAFDPGRGRARLAELGWGDADGDGRLERQGTPLTVTLVSGPGARELPAAIAAQLTEHCGLTVEVRALTEGEWTADWPDGVLFGRQFELALVAWRAAGCAPFQTVQIADAANPGGANFTGYSQPDVDAACRRAWAASPITWPTLRSSRWCWAWPAGGWAGHGLRPSPSSGWPTSGWIGCWGSV